MKNLWRGHSCLPRRRSCRRLWCAALAIAMTGKILAQNQPAPVPAPAASPVPATEPDFTGYIDLGYRWNTGIFGSVPTYRSIVDLGSGPKMLATEFTLINPKKKFFDRIAVRAYDWGDDPYSTLHIDVTKSKWYDFSGDYRNIAYYNNLPAFADPLLANGIALNEQALDTHKKIGTYRLELLPGSKFVPYLEYEHNADNGTGIATFVASANEYPVASLVRDSTENYRGGVRVELSRFHGKFEQGGTTFKDDQGLNSSGYTNYGNVLSPVLGQTLDLTSLQEAYGVRGHSFYTDASFSANPVAWADIYGSFLYSEPVSNVNLFSLDKGNELLLAQALFYTGQQDLIAALSKQPHTSANFGAEIRPFSRLRLIESWFTDRMHTTGSNANQDVLSTAAGLVPATSLLSSTLVSNTNQFEINVIYDLTRKITLRGGYRYVWGNASDGTLPLAGSLSGLEQGKIRTNVAIAGASWHPLQNAWVNLDFEDGSSGSTYFRTSLYNYQRTRIRGRHQISNAFSVSAGVSVLNNTNPTPGINYSFLTHQESASLSYTPSGGKWWDFEGGYTRSTLRSDINYLDPEFLIPEVSFYRDNNHSVNALFDLNVPGWLGLKTRLTLGGSAFFSSGSNPTTFYQPTAKVAMDVYKHVKWITEWRYYGFNEAFYVYQGFRSQMVMTGVRLTR